MAANDSSRYLAPPWDARPDAKLGWLREAEQEGTAFLKGNRAYTDLDKGIDIIAGIDDDPVPDSLSNVQSNRTKRQLREVVATLSNLRPLWGYTSDNAEFIQAAENLNKLVYGWWLATFADRQIRAALQWACVSTGWVYPQWNPDYWYRGRGDVVLGVHGPRDVLPVQMGKDIDIQQAYAVIIQSEEPISRVHAQFPQFADQIKPDRDSPNWFYSRVIRPVQRYASPVGNAIFGEKESVTTSGPMVDTFDVYILDTLINKTGKPIRMGKPGTSWEYEVPYIGQQIPVEKDALGRTLSREARPEDCFLFPLRRRMRATRNCILEDGSSPWWHGRVPLAKFTVDDWPNEFLGLGLVRDLAPLQKSYNRHLRGADDLVEKSLKPDVGYDPNIMARSEIERYDPRRPGNRIPMNFSLGKGFEIQPSPELKPEVYAHMTFLREEMDYLMAIGDMRNLAKANQIPSGESIDKLVELAGPVVTDISRSMERSLRDVGEFTKCLFYQFYDAPRKVQVLGRAGITEEDFLFDPNSLIPSGMRSQIYMGEIIPQNLARAKRAMNGCIFHITPNSLHQQQQMTRKLLYFQLWRDGRFPIDPETVGEAMDIPDFGSLEAIAEEFGIDTSKRKAQGVLGRYFLFQELMLASQMKMQAVIAQQQMAMGLQAQAAGVEALAGQAMQAGGVGKPNGQVNEGRPPSGQKPPVLRSKDGGTRSTIEES